MPSIIAKMQTDDSITVALNDGSYLTYNSNLNEVREAIKDNDVDTLVALSSKEKQVKSYTKGLAEVVDGEVLFNGEELHGVLVDKILDFMQDGLDFDYLLRFIENVKLNPSEVSVDDLYRFLEGNNVTITSEGEMLLCKAVDLDYSSVTKQANLTLLQGRYLPNNGLDCSIGQVIECVRDDVDGDRNQECSHGLHVGGMAYSGPNGWFTNSNTRTVIVKVNPKDVVSVPEDHNSTKMRVCKFEVMYDYKPLGKVDKKIEYLEVDDLFEGDIITFVYTNLKGETKQRYCMVESIDDKNMLCKLLRNDPSYGEDEENNVRYFSLDRIIEIQDYEEKSLTFDDLKVGDKVEFTFYGENRAMEIYHIDKGEHRYFKSYKLLPRDKYYGDGEQPRMIYESEIENLRYYE